MAGQGREDAGEVPAAAGCPAAQNAPGERMRGCGPVPSPQVSMTSTAHAHVHTTHTHKHTHTQPVAHVRSAPEGVPSHDPVLFVRYIFREIVHMRAVKAVTIAADLRA